MREAAGYAPIPGGDDDGGQWTSVDGGGTTISEWLLDAGKTWVFDPTTGLPVGQVTTTISDDGLTIRNATNWDHVFYDGRVDRGAYQGSDGEWYVLTHGYATRRFEDCCA
jgi:hypothetical protein